MDPYFISTAIPYVNGKPHLGHTQEFIITDSLARFQRMRGRDVYFLSGTDENSLKNVQAAEAEGVETQTLVDRNAAYFYRLRRQLNLTFDDFIRTSVDARHRPGVEKLWLACAANGDIYQKEYSGLYCVGCEQFYKQSELTADGLCPEHLRPPEWVAERNYFFRLSRYQQQLRQLIASDQLAILPSYRKRELLNFIDAGLEDFSISRSRQRAHGWGIPVPGDADQVIYVWFDALGNYITALDYQAEGERYQRYWLHNPERTHVIGKGITRFHAIYWPAMLLSAGVPLPTTICVHGYVTAEGQKLSKSLGNAVDPVDLVDQFGPDTIRYYLLREVQSTQDGDFTYRRLVQAHHGELADQLGNLLSRVVGMVSKYYDGRTPQPPPNADEGLLFAELAGAAAAAPQQVAQAMARFETHIALSSIWELIGAANRYVDASQPWTIARRRRQGDASAEAELAAVLYNLVESLRLVAYLLHPFLPASSQVIADRLSCPSWGPWQDETRWGVTKPGRVLHAGAVLFQKLEEEAPPSAAGETA